MTGEDVAFPLIVRGPQMAPKTVDDRLVSTIDLAPTFADLRTPLPSQQSTEGPFCR